MNTTKKVNALVLRLASFQAALLHNLNAYDDDLEDTWSHVKDDYEALKISIDKYIKQQEARSNQ